MPQRSHSSKNRNTSPHARETWRQRIARQAEEACHLPGNKNGPDLEEFERKYGFTGSDFA